MASPVRPRSPVPSVILGVLAAASWLVAASGHLAWSLATGGNLPAGLLALTWPRGPIVWVRGGAAIVAVVLTVLLIQRLARRGWLTAVACIPLVMGGGLASATPYPGAALAFEVWRPLFLQARDVLEPAAVTVDSYYGPDLPDDLALLSSTGFVSIRERGSIFFPAVVRHPRRCRRLLVPPRRRLAGRVGHVGHELRPAAVHRAPLVVVRHRRRRPRPMVSLLACPRHVAPPASRF